MKIIYLLIIFVIFSLSVSGQKLLDIYKKGTVHLVADLEYGKGNNWNNVFKAYIDSAENKRKQNRKSLVIMPDGGVVVNNYDRNYYTKFLPNGKFEKEFGITNSKGVQLKKIEGITGIVNNKIFFTGVDNMGKMNCFDFNGQFIKTMKFNYSSRQMIALPNNKIAVVGWVGWQDKTRDFVSIVDYNTNVEKIVWDHFSAIMGFQEHESLFSYGYKFKEHGAFGFRSMPYTNGNGLSSPPQISCVNNKLIIGLAGTGEILVYDLDGNLKSKEKINWPLNYLSVQEQKDIQKNAIDNFKNSTNSKIASWVSDEESKIAYESIIKSMEADLLIIKDPILIPVFSTIIKDSDGNLLFFEQAKEENGNKFNVWVYGQKGSFICKSNFACDDYELEINPSKIEFYKGYIYGLQHLKNAKNGPLHLVRFKLE